VVIGIVAAYMSGMFSINSRTHEKEYRRATEQTQSSVNETIQSNSQSTSTTQTQPTEDKTEDVVDQDAVTLKNALKKEDYKTVQRLANNGYAPSYGPLAKYYLKNNEYELAETYANKAKAAGYSDGTKVITALTQLGYYD
jgi:hypothetical protein